MHQEKSTEKKEKYFFFYFHEIRQNAGKMAQAVIQFELNAS